MIEILYERMDMHKDKFISKILLNELRTLEVDKHGKVQAVSPNHDDQVFSYLHAMRIWYDGEELADRYGIRKNTIRTDEDIEIEQSSLEQMESSQRLDLESVTRIEPEVTATGEVTKEDSLSAQLAILESDRTMLQQQFNASNYEQEEGDFRLFLQLNKDARDEYNRVYHVDGSNMMDASPTIQLPDNIFGNVCEDPEEAAAQKELQLHGNLFGMYNRM